MDEGACEGRDAKPSVTGHPPVVASSAVGILLPTSLFFCGPSPQHLLASLLNILPRAFGALKN